MKDADECNGVEVVVVEKGGGLGVGGNPLKDGWDSPRGSLRRPIGAEGGRPGPSIIRGGEGAPPLTGEGPYESPVWTRSTTQIVSPTQQNTRAKLLTMPLHFKRGTDADKKKKNPHKAYANFSLAVTAVAHVWYEIESQGPCVPVHKSTPLVPPVHYQKQTIQNPTASHPMTCVCYTKVCSKHPSLKQPVMKLQTVKPNISVHIL